MRKGSIIIYMTVILIFALITAVPLPRRANASDTSLPSEGTLRIFGEVNRPLNLPYDELLSFPLVSEVAELKCVDGYPDFIANWTGIPLFYLLTLAQINSDAYKVVTWGSDGYSSDLLLVDALKPTTILALKDRVYNGSTPSVAEAGPFPRLVVPNNWGYKWVDEVDSIEVVNYNYQGTYESSGYSDNGTRPGLTVLPSITPPLQELNFASGNLTFNVQAFTNASISAYSLNYSQKRISLNVTVPPGTVGFADFEIPQEFLKSPYNVTIDNHAVNIIEADLANQSYMANQSYIYVVLPEGFHSVSIVGKGGIFEFTPEINLILPQNVYVGEKATFNASKSIAYGTIISYEWSFGDGTNGTGAVVSHSYNKEGTYQMELNITDNYDLSTSETFTITVGTPPQYVPLALEALLAMMLILLILMFAVLMRSRGKEGTLKQMGSDSQQSVDQVTQINGTRVCAEIKSFSMA